MATTTTNYSFTLPTVGAETDQWGTQLNNNWTSLDSTLKTVADSVGDDVSLTGNDYLTITGQAITVGDVDLTTDVTGTLPVGSGGTGLAALGSPNQVLAVNSTADGLEFQTVSGSGTVTSVAVTGSDGIEVDSGSPITASGTIALGVNATTLSTHLGLGSLATQSSVTESQISDLQSYITASSTDTLTNKSGNISQWTNDSGYLTSESNDLSASVTWANVPDVNITQSSVTQHQAALSITESQISDLGTYQTADAGLTSIAGLTTVADRMIYTTAADTYAVATLTSAGRALLDDADAAAQRTTLGLGSLATQSTITESQISDLQTYLTAETNDLGSAVTGTLGTANGGTGVTALSSLNAADLGSNNGVSDATDGYVLTADGLGGTAWEAATGGLSDVVSDTTPQLGGNLDVNGNSIVSASAGNISITPDTTGKIILDGLSWPTADGSADQVLTTDGLGNLSFVDQSGGGGGLSDLEHANSISTAQTISSGQHRFYVGPMTFSNDVTIAGKLLVFDGSYNQTSGTTNVTGTLNIRG